MHDIPPVSPVAEAPDALRDGGHLWVQEYVDGAPMRVQLRDSGLLVFGDQTATFDGDPPLGYRHAVRHVREQFDRAPLRAALDDVTALTLYGVVTRGLDADYDRDSLPLFLLVDSWADPEGGLLPPDAVDRLATRVGLSSLPAVQKEVRAVDFDFDDVSFPASTWRDGPAAAVLVRNKTGDRAFVSNPAVTHDSESNSQSAATGAADLAADLVTPERIDRARATMEAEVPDSDALAERLVELLAHEEFDALLGDRATVDLDALEREVGALVRQHLEDRGDGRQ